MKLPDTISLSPGNLLLSVHEMYQKIRNAVNAHHNKGLIKARAYRNAAQNIDATAWTKVAIDTISFDAENVVDVTTNNRITPNLPGCYIVAGNVRVNNVPDGERAMAAIYKNGSWATTGSYSEQGASGVPSSNVPDLVYMNGTTDYLELYAFNSHSSDLALYVGDPASAHNYIFIVGPF